MRLAFLILAHERPAVAVSLARTLAAAGSDAISLLHFDRRMGPSPVGAGVGDPAGEPARGRVEILDARVACRWGGFGLVEAPLAGLRALVRRERETGWRPDYVTLLSGACLPCRPVAQLERFLSERRGREFLECEDAAWVTGGLREERWSRWFPFDHKTQRPLEHNFLLLQRALSVTRRFPEGLTPRFGSQWWTLSWETCAKIVDYAAENPAHVDFFRHVWIPDEMMFQTLVHRLAGPEAAAGFPLTLYQFTGKGKPIVFFDDHAAYVDELPRFFLRKAHPRAERLRARCLGLAGAPDDGRPLDAIGRPWPGYAVKARLQTRHPRPGQLFWRDQYADFARGPLAAMREPYVVLFGPPEPARPFEAAFAAEGFDVFGRIFAPGRIDFGPGREAFGPFRSADWRLRDLHPTLFLARLRARTRKTPVIRLSPLDPGPVVEAILHDDSALIVAFLPEAGAPGAGAPEAGAPGADSPKAGSPEGVVARLAAAARASEAAADDVLACFADPGPEEAALAALREHGLVDAEAAGLEAEAARRSALAAAPRLLRALLGVEAGEDAGEAAGEAAGAGARGLERVWRAPLDGAGGAGDAAAPRPRVETARLVSAARGDAGSGAVEAALARGWREVSAKAAPRDAGARREPVALRTAAP